jgi:peroxin-2
MPAADFAAAQQRIAARRAQRAASQRAHHESTPSSRALHLPTPFSSAWDAIKGRSGTRPSFRVGQVDAELLDEELLDLLKGQVNEGLKYFGTHIVDNYTPEILLSLRLILFKLSIWDQSASYGAHLQGLRYTDARSNAPNRPPPKPWQKAAYGLITIGGRYAWHKWEEYLLSAQEDYTRPESAHLTLLTSLTTRLNSAHDIASLASFLVFLVNGRYRTLTDRLLRLRLTPTSASTSREVSFEYLNRQLVWHAFTEFLLFLLPLVGVSRWRRILARSWRKLRTAGLNLLGRNTPSAQDDAEHEKSGELSFLPERTCAICYRDQNPSSGSEADVLASSAGGGGVVGSAATDITNPYQADACGCIYCFACIAQRIANEEGEGWTCLRCGETVKECRPWTGDIIEPKQHARADARVVEFDTADREGVVLREVEPMPEQEEEDESVVGDSGLEKTRGLDLGDSLAWTESSEWARQADSEDSDEDQQSEEYDEDEEEEGDELGSVGGFDYEQ